MVCFLCYRRLLFPAQITQGPLRGPLFNPPQDNVLSSLKRTSLQAQRTLRMSTAIHGHTNILNSAVHCQFVKMTRSELFEENTKVVRGKLRKFTARNGLSTSTACNETSQMVQPPPLVFTQATLLLPLSSWTLTGVC